MEEKRLNLFGTTYKIKYKDNVLIDNTNVYGKTDYASHTIEVAKKLDKIKVSIEEQRLTLLHELFHAILKEGQYLSCADDEPLVEWLARGINEAIKKKII